LKCLWIRIFNIAKMGLLPIDIVSIE
jgi:hypothetical protein